MSDASITPESAGPAGAGAGAAGPAHAAGAAGAASGVGSDAGAATAAGAGVAGAGAASGATVTAGVAGATCEIPAPASAGATAAAVAPRIWQGPSAQERLSILRRAKSIAIVGASNNPARASYFVATYLLSSSPYDVYFVNPVADEILGRKAYDSLADLPVVPDVVDVFRKHDDLPGVAREAVEVGAKALWLQLGSWNEEAAAIAENAGLEVVMDRCIKIEHARFHGGLHLAGFDTGVISSKRQVVA